MNYYYYCKDQNIPGCCLICPDKKEGCLCPECKCTQCEEYGQNWYKGVFFVKGYCKIAEKRKEQQGKNLQILFKQDGWVELRILGPINKESYARLKPFLKEHFHYNFERKCYEVYTVNWRFIRLFRETLKKTGFCPVEKIEKTQPNKLLEVSF